MKTERKFISLKALKVSDEGSGSIEGYRSVFGEIDEGGEIVVKGAFTECIPEYLLSGFTAESHDWDFSKAVGYPIDAVEDDYGWKVTSQFHSTPDAQNVRIKAQERFAAGKTVGFSFGYRVDEDVIIQQKDFKDQLPLYIKPERLEINLQKAQKFNRIRILKRVSAIEDSLVTSPMNKLAAATGVKSCDCFVRNIRPCVHGADGKGMLAEEMAETVPSFWQTESAYCRVIRKIAESAKNGDVTGVEFDWRSKVNEVSTELGTEAAAIATAQIEAYLESSDDEFYLKEDSGTDSFESFESVESALKKFTENMQRNHENRVKEGRILSASNRAKVVAARDALDELLAASEPPPPKEKDVDVAALRTQAMQLSGKALAALSR